MPFIITLITGILIVVTMVKMFDKKHTTNYKNADQKIEKNSKEISRITSEILQNDGFNINPNKGIKRG